MISVLPIESWVGRAPTKADAKEVFKRELEQIYLAGGVSCVNVPLFEKGEYLGGTPKEVNVQAWNAELIAHALTRFHAVTTSGPQLLKHHGLAERLALKIAQGDAAVIHKGEAFLADSRGFVEFTAGTLDLKALSHRTVTRFIFSCSGKGGELFLKWPNGSVMQKSGVSGGGSLVEIVFITFQTLTPSYWEYRGGSGDRLVLHEIRVNDSRANELDVNGDWIGNDGSGFFHSRCPNPRDTQGVWDSLFQIQKLPKTALLFDWEELNSPLGHDGEERMKWIGQMTDTAANVAYRLTGQVPIFFRTDPRTRSLDHRFHRCCAPTSDMEYLDEVDPRTPVKFLLWGEGGNKDFWGFELSRLKGRKIILGYYAGTQKLAPIFEALQVQRLDPRAQEWAICYTAKHWPSVLADLAELKDRLTQ